MSKAVLVMDMQYSCDACMLSGCAHDSELFEEGECYCIAKCESVDDVKEGCKPDWCPLKPMPEKREISHTGMYETGYENGWNTCIGVICGEV